MKQMFILPTDATSKSKTDRIISTGTTSEKETCIIERNEISERDRHNTYKHYVREREQQYYNYRYYF